MHNFFAVAMGLFSPAPSLYERPKHNELIDPAITQAIGNTVVDHQVEIPQSITKRSFESRKKAFLASAEAYKAGELSLEDQLLTAKKFWNILQIQAPGPEDIGKNYYDTVAEVITQTQEKRRTYLRLFSWPVLLNLVNREKLVENTDPAFDTAGQQHRTNREVLAIDVPQHTFGQLTRAPQGSIKLQSNGRTFVRSYKLPKLGNSGEEHVINQGDRQAYIARLKQLGHHTLINNMDWTVGLVEFNSIPLHISGGAQEAYNRVDPIIIPELEFGVMLFHRLSGGDQARRSVHFVNETGTPLTQDGSLATPEHLATVSNNQPGLRLASYTGTFVSMSETIFTSRFAEPLPKIGQTAAGQ